MALEMVAGIAIGTRGSVAWNETSVSCTLPATRTALIDVDELLMTILPVLWMPMPGTSAAENLCWACVERAPIAARRMKAFRMG